MSRTPYAGPTVVRRQLGHRLKRLRKGLGIEVDAVVAAPNLDISRAKLFRLEAGKHPARTQDIAALCLHYGANDTETEALTTLAQGTAGESWWHPYGADSVPEWFSLYADLEPAATKIRGYEAELVPGLLQTQDYAREVCRARNPHEPATEITRRVTIRMERATILDRDNPPQLDLVLNEAVLLRRVGGGPVMAKQLDHLLAIASRPNINVRVLPMDIGAHASMEATFSILDFADAETDPSVVYIDSPSSAAYLQQQAELSRYTFIFTEVASRSITIQEYSS